MSKFLIAATVATGFFRCGTHFPEDGITVDEEDFTDKQWDRLRAEARLRISDASDDTLEVDEDRKNALVGAITTLSAEDFQRDGKPKLDALRALLGDELGKISGAERDIVWDAMLDNGFEAPTASS